MQKSSLIIATLIFIVSASWIASGVLFASDDKEKKNIFVTPEKEKQAVLVQKFSAQDFTNNLVVNGRSQASRVVTVKAEISAQVSEIIQEKGSIVTKGQNIINLKEDDRALLVKEAQQRVRQRKIEYNAALKLKKEGFNSNVRVAEVRADLESARAVLARAQLDLENIHIIAPFDGVIDRQYVEIGDFLSLGQDIIKLVDLDPIEFEVFVAEKDIQDVKKNRIATVTLMNGTELKGKVTYIAVSADENTRTFPVEISVENKDYTLKEGLTVELKIPLQPKKAHRIPSSLLLLNDKGQIGVRAVDDQNIIQFFPIKILASDGGFNWVTGLKQDITLIIQGQDFVADGHEAIVTFAEPKTPKDTGTIK